ncbi:MAG: MAPEG family protein [Sphingomonas bacterium]|nr:MAPEG family protein [Sphingomonas bacterium]
MEHHPLLQPVVALLAWSAIMFVWMYATRIPAMVKAGGDLQNRVGGQGSDLDKILPPEVQWKAHNYNHLMEQPTLFYAACFVLVLTDCESPIALYAAWAYVGLRVLHSLVQSLSNRIRYRFGIFLLASIALIVLIGVAVCAVI